MIEIHFHVLYQLSRTRDSERTRGNKGEENQIDLLHIQVQHPYPYVFVAQRN